MNFDALKPEVLDIIQSNSNSTEERMTAICKLLKEKIDHYNWVGFYFVNGDKAELLLQTFAGAPTDHTVIPFGRGICGQVAVSNQNFVVPDVRAQDNYIACSIDVKSEIVVPLFKDGKNIGQIDIDSHTIDPFTKEDEDFLTWVNKQVSEIL